MNIKGLILAVITVLAFGTSANADADITVKYNNDILCFAEQPIIRNDKTLVQLRPIAEAMGLNIDYITDSKEVVLSGNETTVVFTNDSDIIKINGRELKMIAPVVNHHDYTFVPVRDLAEPFGEVVSYDGETKTVTIETPVPEETEETEALAEADDADVLAESEVDIYAQTDGKRPLANPLIPERDVTTGSGKYQSCFYYQSQPDMELEASGKGYCWVCSYAMVLTNLMGEKVTPIQVANVNIEAGYQGNFMYHTAIAGKFGVKLVPALSEDSAYFDSFIAEPRGATMLKFEDEQGVISALKEALSQHPEGIMVRFDGYPHTMVAVGFDDENIYFNDPGIAEGEHLTFDKTCLKNYKLTDISFIQALSIDEE